MSTALNILVVYGPQGCGKTRNAKALLNLVSPAPRLIDGMMLADMPAAIEDQIQLRGARSFLVLTHEGNASNFLKSKLKYARVNNMSFLTAMSVLTAIGVLKNDQT